MFATLAGVLLGAATVLAASSDGSSKPPNIIWVMADDLGWGEVGVFPCTSPHGRIATPNLDKFASEGMMFTDAYAGYTVCAPSRTTLFTGHHSGQFQKFQLAGTNLPVNQTTSKNTTAQLLQTAGYTTAAFGKTAPLAVPVEQGFGTFLGQVNQAACHNMYPEFIDSGAEQFNVNLTLNHKTKDRSLTMGHPNEYNYTIDITHNAGAAWLANHVQRHRDDPFFLYLSFTVPHAGGWGSWPNSPEQGAPVPTDGQYTNTSWPDVERDHASVITYLDNYVGENGAHKEGGHKVEFFNSTGGLKGQKRSLFEGGVRSPSMVRWPGVVKPGSVSTHQWAFWDFMPTALDIAGASSLAPKDIDGISIYPTLTGKGTQGTHPYLYWTWDGTGVGDDNETPGYGVRIGNWKGVVPHCADTKGRQPSSADPVQLYDLAADPFETTDVAAAHPDEVRTLLNTVIAADLSCDCYQC